MKTLVVLEGDCGEQGKQFEKWLEKNLDDDVELDYRVNCGGVGGGLFDETGGEILEGDEGYINYWSLYCDIGQEEFEAISKLI